MTALTDLLAALESGISKSIDIAVLAVAAKLDRPGLIEQAYTGNTQAAIDFIEAALPGWHWSVSHSRSGYGATVWHEGRSPMPIHTATGPTPAFALLIAAVKALVAIEKAKEPTP